MGAALGVLVALVVRTGRRVGRMVLPLGLGFLWVAAVVLGSTNRGRLTLRAVAAETRLGARLALALMLGQHRGSALQAWKRFWLAHVGLSRAATVALQTTALVAGAELEYVYQSPRTNLSRLYKVDSLRDELALSGVLRRYTPAYDCVRSDGLPGVTHRGNRDVFLCVSVCLSVMSVCICLPVCLSVMSLCLYVCLSVCL